MVDNIRKKLIGTEDERAVSPVIGVILMVAITVILAAVIAAFVLDLGDSVGQEAQAGASIDVTNSSTTQEIQVEVTSLGNADHVRLAGDFNDDDVTLETGDVETFTWDPDTGEFDDTSQWPTDGDWDISSGEEGTLSGTVTVVAVIEGDGTETQVASEDFEFAYEVP